MFLEKPGKGKDTLDLEAKPNFSEVIHEMSFCLLGCCEVLLIHVFPFSDPKLKPRIILMNALPRSYNPSPGKKDKNKTSEKNWVREGGQGLMCKYTWLVHGMRRPWHARGQLEGAGVCKRLREHRETSISILGH